MPKVGWKHWADLAVTPLISGNHLSFLGIAVFLLSAHVTGGNHADQHSAIAQCKIDVQLPPIIGLSQRVQPYFRAVYNGMVDATRVARIQQLPLAHAEALAEALLDFQTPADLAAWPAGQERGDS